MACWSTAVSKSFECVFQMSHRNERDRHSFCINTTHLNYDHVRMDASELELFVFLQRISLCDSVARRAQLTNIHNLFHRTRWGSYHQKISEYRFDCVVPSARSIDPRKYVQCDICKLGPDAAISEEWIRQVVPSNEEESTLVSIGGFVMFLQ